MTKTSPQLDVFRTSYNHIPKGELMDALGYIVAQTDPDMISDACDEVFTYSELEDLISNLQLKIENRDE